MSCVWDNTWLPDEPSHQLTDADNQARLSLLLTVVSVAAKEETLIWPDWSAPSRICWWGRSCRPPGPPPPAPTPGPAWLGLPHISHVTSRWVRGHRHGVRVTAWQCDSTRSLGTVSTLAAARALFSPRRPALDWLDTGCCGAEHWALRAAWETGYKQYGLSSRYTRQHFLVTIILRFSTLDNLILYLLPTVVVYISRKIATSSRGQDPHYKPYN